jgi:hypothetical protein
VADKRFAEVQAYLLTYVQGMSGVFELFNKWCQNLINARLDYLKFYNIGFDGRRVMIIDDSIEALHRMIWYMSTAEDIHQLNVASNNTNAP